jgi:hypothetical protein
VEVRRCTGEHLSESAMDAFGDVSFISTLVSLGMVIFDLFKLV